MTYQFQTICFDDPPISGRMVDLYPVAGSPRPHAVFLVHGGGWRMGTRQQMLQVAMALRSLGYVCGSTDYRLGDALVATQLEDVATGYHLFRRWVEETYGSIPVTVYGSSAGGHLAGLMAFSPSACFDGVVAARGGCWRRPAGAVLVSAPMSFEPWEDIFPEIWRSMQAVTGVPWETDPEAYRRASIMRLIGPDAPPTLLLDGANEHVFPHAINEMFVERMRQAGARAERHVFATAEHGFLYDVIRRPQRLAFERMSAFLESLSR